MWLGTQVAQAACSEGDQSNIVLLRLDLDLFMFSPIEFVF